MRCCEKRMVQWEKNVVRAQKPSAYRAKPNKNFNCWQLLVFKMAARFFYSVRLFVVLAHVNINIQPIPVPLMVTRTVLITRNTYH